MSIRSFFCIGLLLVLSNHAHSQQAMELYIPIGKSVGVSNTSSIIGKVAAVDEQNKSLSITGASETFTVAVPDNTPVWLDRSKAAKTNEVGSMSDIKPEAMVEVKHKEAARGPSLTAEWIKVETAR